MAQQSWVALANDGFQPTAAVTTNTFTGPNDITTGNTLTVPGNFFRTGQQWRWTASGTYSVTGTPTLAFGMYIGAPATGTLQAPAGGTAVFTASSGVTTLPWEFTGRLTVRSIGTAGTALATGRLHYGTTNTSTFNTLLYPFSVAQGIGSTFNTTVSNVFTVGCTFSASSASNIVVLNQLLIEYLN